MRVVVVGAYGLLGSYITQRLVRDGHDIVGVGRDVRVAQRRFPGVHWVEADLRRATESDWSDVLAGAEAVVNCAGALQDSPRDDLKTLHVGAVDILRRACAATGVRRFVQISAVGVDSGGGRFGQTKQEADALLRASELEWVILRPGLVLAPSAYGGSALLRGLAAFPGFIPAVAPQSVVQTVWIEDVADAVSRSVLPQSPTRITCDLVSAERTSLGDVLKAMRAWLGLSDAPIVRVPEWAGRLCALAADALAALGWRSPMRTAAVQQLSAGVQGRSTDAERLLGAPARSLASALAGSPAGVQERWYARLYFVKPLVLAGLAAFWASSGIIGLGSRDAAVGLLAHAGFDNGLARALVLAGCIGDLSLAALVCFRRTAGLALKGMILVTVAYLAAATVWSPGLWVDPLGPLVKSIPAALLALTALAMMDER